MKNYYLLSGKNSKKVASAFKPVGSKQAYELISELDGKNTLPFELNLIKLTVGRNGLIESNDLSGLEELWLDYQPNNLAWPLFSERLKRIIENYLTGREEIDWISTIVKGGNEERVYYIPRFNKTLDVLNLEKTTFVPGTDRIMKPVFSVDKIKSYSIFNKPSADGLKKIGHGVYTNEIVKKAIQQESLTGIVFEKTSVA